MPTDRPIVISLYNPPNSQNQQPLRHETTVQELITSLCAEPERVDKKGNAVAWAPFDYRDGHRKAANALGACALVYDLDDPDYDFPALGARLEALGWVYVIHETYTDGCARLVLPLARDCPPEAYAPLREGVAQRLELVHDPACSDLARLFYAPSCAHGAERSPGETGGTTLLEPSIPERALDLQALRTEVERLKDPEKRNKLLELVDGTLRLPPGTRNSTMHALLGTLACTRHAPSPEATEELVRRVLSTREGAEAHLGEWVKEAMHSYDRGREFKATHDAEAAKVEAFLTGKGTATAAEDESWKAKLAYRMGTDGEVKGLKVNEANICAVLRNDPAFRGHIRWNDLTKCIEVTGGALAGEGPETLDTSAAIWMQRSDYKFDPDSRIAGLCVQHVAMHQHYDPVREFLEKLPQWDGEKRLAYMLTRYAGAVGSAPWIELITEKFFVAAVARAMRPGCQVDNVLVLQGPQGGGKTSLVRAMGAGFSLETNLDLRNKDAVMVASSAWLVELGELASLRGADIETVRSFLTRKEDVIRLPYGRAVKAFPRRCVYIGTTNSFTPLTDPEGNRRMWVVSVGKVDTHGIEAVRDQLWAEALHLFRAGKEWWLNPAEAARAAEEAKVYEEEEPLVEQVRAYLQSCSEERWPQVLSGVDVATIVLGKMPGDVTKDLVRNINRTLRNKLGWHRTRLGESGSWTFRVPPRESFFGEVKMDRTAPVLQ